MEMCNGSMLCPPDLYDPGLLLIIPFTAAAMPPQRSKQNVEYLAVKLYVQFPIYFMSLTNYLRKQCYWPITIIPDSIQCFCSLEEQI